MEVRSVLIIRLSAIGDVVMASGLIGALRARYPEARLFWLVQPEARDLLLANPQLDGVIVWPRAEWARLARGFRWWRLAREVTAFVKSLRAHRFDTAIDAQGLLKSGLWAWLSGARERIGLGSREGSAHLMTRVVDKPRGDKRIAAEYRHLAREFGQDPERYRMQVPVTDEDNTYIKELLARRGVQGAYLAICPFTTRPQKHWFESRWTDFARQARATLGLPVVMLGGPGDRDAALRIAAADAVVNLAGETTLRQAAALIRGATLLVGVDTALTHIGSALEVPTIVLFGSTFPYSHTDSPRTQVIYHKIDCSPCKRHPTCGGVFTCMRMIESGDVVRVAQGLLAS